VPAIVATGAQPNQRSSPKPIKGGSENPAAIVVTLDAHSTPTIKPDRDSGFSSTDDSRFPAGG